MNCFLCNNPLKESTYFQICITYTKHSNTLLVNFIKKILNCDILKSQSKAVCTECYTIVDELDFAEITSVRLKAQLFQRWMFSEYDTDKFMRDVSCQTDEYPNDKDFTDLSESILLDVIKKETEDNLENTDKQNEDVISPNITKVRDKNKPYKCEICEKQFASKNGMVLHTQRQHKNESNAPIKEECNLMIEEFTKSEPDSSCLDIDGLQEDDSSNSSTNNDSSPKIAKGKRKLKKKKFGVQNKCGIKAKPLKYPCPHCSKMWRTMGELRSHISSHSSLRPYICEVCGQAYKHKSALDVHVGMHNGINPFSCQFCHKSFTQKGALQRHLPIHTGDAPYQCDLCGKRFVHHTSFNMHTLAHTGQKSYKCTVCGLAFLSGSHLKRHMRVHTGERPYSCTQCGKRFAERYNLAAHQRLHDAGPSETAKRLYRCQVCGAGFDRRPKLEEHLSNNHNKISENDQSRKWVGHFLTNS